MGAARPSREHPCRMHGLDTRSPQAGITLPGDDAARAARVLVVEAEQQPLALMERVLRRHGHEPLSARSGAEALRLLYSERPDLIVLDLDLPDMEGRALLERMRAASGVPIMIVAESAAEDDAVTALRAGADDFVTKPYGTQEVLARVDALLRRARPAAGPPLTYADPLLEIDFGSLDVRIAGESVALTALELRVLATFVEHRGRILSAEQILGLVWDDPHAPRDRVKLYVGYLREKFRDRGVESPIETVRGFGYRYRPPA